jgi:hypothetical protein
MPITCKDIWPCCSVRSQNTNVSQTNWCRHVFHWIKLYFMIGALIVLWVYSRFINSLNVGILNTSTAIGFDCIQILQWYCVIFVMIDFSCRIFYSFLHIHILLQSSRLFVPYWINVFDSFRCLAMPAVWSIYDLPMSSNR